MFLQHIYIYANMDQAVSENAVYYVPSSISLHGHSGLCDLMEIISTLKSAIGCGEDITAFIRAENGNYYSIANLL